MLTNRDIKMLAYIKSQGKIVKFGNDIHPYDDDELKELVKQNLLRRSDHTMPAPKGDHPDHGYAYVLTRRGENVLSDCLEAQAKARRNDRILLITLVVAILTAVLTALTLII